MMERNSTRSMKEGSLVHRMLWPEQATILPLAIADYRKKLMRVLEDETERFIDAERRPANSEPEILRRNLRPSTR